MASVATELSRASIATAHQVGWMEIDRTRQVRPLLEVCCPHCGATGDLSSIGAAWHRGAIERCSYFDAAAGPANLVGCPHMMEGLEVVRRPKTA
jgi:hypothetical protein